jgi:hypothetical protein
MTISTYLTTSPYISTPQVNFYVPYLDWWNAPTIGSSNTDTIITVSARYNRRPDLLSNDIYGTPGYWWVFAVRNPNIIKDPIFDMVTGITIYAPDKSNIPNGLS